MARKLVYFAIAIFAVIALAAVALPLLISSDSVRATLLNTAKEITGREMEFSGTPKVSFNPFLGIEISDVKFNDQFGGPGSAPILSMPKLKGKLSIASAITGKVELTEFQFIRPKFHLKVFSSGQTSWQFEEGKVWDILESAQALRNNAPTGEKLDVTKLRSVVLGNFSIVDGQIEYENEITGASETVTNLNGNLSWPNTHSPWNFEASGIWRGDAMNFTTTAVEPIFLLSGGASLMSASVDSEPVKLTFNGEANRFSNLFVNGDIDISSPSLRRLANLFGAELSPGSTLGQFSAKGGFTGTLNQFEMADAEFILDGNTANGTLKIVKTENSLNKLTGTLAFSQFNLEPYIQFIQQDIASNNTIANELNAFKSFEMDLRVSSPSIIAQELEILNYAGGIKNKDGQFSMTIGNAEIAGGLVVGNFEVGAKEEDTIISTAINISNLNTENFKLLPSISKIQPIGIGNIDVKLTSEGKNFETIVRNLTGETNISFKKGVLNGLALATLKDTSEKQSDQKPKFGDFDGKAQTQFDELELSVLINRGVGWITKGIVKSEELTSELAGKLDLHLGTLALRGRFVEINEDQTENQNYFGSYFIGGTMRQPLYVLE